MEHELSAAVRSYLNNIPDDALRAGFGGDSDTLDRNKDYVFSNVTGHIVSVYDDEYMRMLHEVRTAGPRWKGRARDFKGQYFKTKYQDGVIQGWSLRQHKYVLVVPWSFGQHLKCFFDKVNAQIVRNDPVKSARLAAYNTDLQRNYEATSGQRATARHLNERPHRQQLNGRRNHFVSVPSLI